MNDVGTGTVQLDSGDEDLLRAYSYDEDGEVADLRYVLEVACIYWTKHGRCVIFW